MALGWAINGMIGSAPGAAIPGAFIGMAVAGILGIARDGRQGESLPALGLARIAAFGAIGFWFGGEMTYGQMFGLTNVNVAGGSHYWWGILGTAVKGSAWQGVGAACIGLGLMRGRYRWWEIALLMTAMTAASVVGVLLLNRPWGPSGSLPPVCFSYDPVDPANPKNLPRTEHWAGLWAGLIVLLVYAGLIKRDRVTFRFGVFGVVGGGLGFSVGQMLQAFSWAHPEFAFRPWIDWWKVMELTFGFVGGVFIALAALTTPRQALRSDAPEPKSTPLVVEWLGMGVWVLMVVGYFVREPVTSLLAALPFVAGIVALSGLLFGRYWPWIVVGVQVPLGTSWITATEVLRAYPEDTGWTTNDGRIVGFFEVLSHAWPMLAIGILACVVPTWIWLYRRPGKANAGACIFRLFVGYHLFAVIVQMVWQTLHSAASWRWPDLVSVSRPFWMLVVVYLICWTATMVWLPGGPPSRASSPR